MDKRIHLGYELGTGKAIDIPLKHMAVTGQTQESGKTTTLEALVERGGLRAIAFVTKRAEGAFHGGRRIQPYFRERADWQFVSAVLEATLRERLKFERSWIMRACKGAKTLADVQANVREAMKTAKGLSGDVYMTLDEYLGIVVPQIGRIRWADKVDVQPGLNVMDLGDYSMEMQALIIRSVLEWMYDKEHDTVTIIPEAWEFLPQNRASPVLLAAEQLIRKGAAARNFMWLDSQDIAGVHKNVLRSVIVWILGVQRENNEVKRMLEHVPSMPKPTVQQVMRLKRGQFYACWSDRVVSVYVQPTWVADETAQATARGTITEELPRPLIQRVEDDTVDKAERDRYEKEIGELKARAETAEREVDDLHETMKQNATALATLADVRRSFAALVGGAPSNGKGAAPVRFDTAVIVEEVLRRMPKGQGGTIMVTPPEALRKEFQTREVERVLAYIRELPKRPRDAVRLLEGMSDYISMKRLAERLGIPTGGGSWVDYSKAMNSLVDDGYVDRDDKRGIRGGLRSKLTADLAVYQPTPEDIEQTYAACVAALAEAVPA